MRGVVGFVEGGANDYGIAQSAICDDLVVWSLPFFAGRLEAV
jgi:hypothetical protein